MAVGEGALPDFKGIEGVRIGIAEAGIKKAGRKDLVVFELAPGSACAGVFTRNAFCAAPVTICRTHLAGSSDQNFSRYLLINTGNANAGTGEQGYSDAMACCSKLAELKAVAPECVLPFSTGVIGEYLPVQKIEQGLPSALADLSDNNWASAAEGIMTTDTRPKGVSKEFYYAGERIRIEGISKGAGMIKPNMATMLGFITCDAKLSQGLCQSLISELAEVSFNRITVDGDTSTNDSCILVATGKSAAPEIDPEHPDFSGFKQVLKDAFVELAQLIVRDGEGATKFVAVEVSAAQSTEEALEVAYTIAHSPLVKTALFACDPNWGRILAALGRAAISDFDLSRVDIFLDEVQIVASGGKSLSYTEEAGQKVMNRDEITIRVDLKRGKSSETVWTTDLSHDYVTINAEYRT